MNGWRAASKAESFLSFSLVLGLFVDTRDLSIRSLTRRMRVPIARWRADHFDKRSNRSDVNPWVFSEWVVNALKLRRTSGSFSSIFGTSSVAFVVDDEIPFRKSGPPSQVDSKSVYTVLPRLARSAGLIDVST